MNKKVKKKFTSTEFVTLVGELDRFFQQTSTFAVAILKDARQHTELHKLWVLTLGSVGNHRMNLKFYNNNEKYIIKMYSNWSSF